jgi:hypothetical protein
VLERLTIFLAEARRRSAEYTADWLAKEGNFGVQEVRSLQARYTYRNAGREYHHLEVCHPVDAAKQGVNAEVDAVCDSEQVKGEGHHTYGVDYRSGG